MLADWMRYFLAGYFTSVAVFYAVRLLWRKTPGNLVFMGRPGSTHWYGHATFRVFRVLIWGVCVWRAFSPAADRYLGVFTFWQDPWIEVTAAIMLICGFALALLGHRQLGRDWRSGIDPDGPSQLVTAGLYSLSRNPMYLGVLMAQAGFFLALPSWFTLLCLLVGSVAIVSQVRLEEMHLRNRFPVDFPGYAMQVARWLPIYFQKTN